MIFKVFDEQGNSLILLKLKTLLKEKGILETDAHKMLTATSELISNVVKYATYGDITISDISSNNQLTGIKVIVEDTGPGIKNIELGVQNSNKQAIKFYKKNGFKIVEDEGMKFFNTIHMIKTIF